jgi:hypothetical protein
VAGVGLDAADFDLAAEMWRRRKRLKQMT